MNFKTVYFYLSCISIAVMLSACGDPASEDDTLTDGDPATAIQKEKNNKVQLIFSSIPAQSETMGLLNDAEAKYNAKYLNPIESISKYSSVKSRALNLGVYGIDLGVTNIFDQTQESMLYLRCTNKMATSLGISGAFDEKMSERIDASSDSKDSLLAIITESYRNADNYLQENGQAGVSSLMVAGGWIEGLFVACQIGTATNNEAIMNKIGGEKATLETLISLLDSYKAETDGATEVLTDLTGLKAIYDTITDKITPEQFTQITDKITEIRTKIIQ
ncbi:MAG: hypothetical protein K8R85_10945 [Bacteroidetes bacterium]|nr:hypothetical protein [Bacteroidota bacterium]